MLVALAVGDISRLPEIFHPAPWHGFRPADLVAPILLVVSGGALAATRVRYSGPQAAGIRLLRRVGVLVAAAAGLELLAGTAVEELRPALLLDSALVQLAVAWLAVWWVAGLTRVWQVAIGVGLLLANWLLLGRLDPGTADLLAALPTVVATVLAGYWAGDWLRARPDGPATAIAMALAGLYVGVTGVLGAQVLPLNRTLMTATFVLFGVGVALVVLAGVYVAVTVLPGERLARSVTVLGRHAFPAYITTAVVTVGLGAGRPDSTWERLLGGFGDTFGAELGALLLAGTVVVAAVALTGFLDRRGLDLRA